MNRGARREDVFVDGDSRAVFGLFLKGYRSLASACAAMRWRILVDVEHRHQRARIVLAFADGKRPQEVATATGAVLRTVHEWRRRFEAGGLAALDDLHRRGRPTTLTAGKVHEILQATVHNQPQEATHWSQCLMARHAGVSKEQVAKVRKAADLRPHRIKSFKIRPDP